MSTIQALSAQPSLSGGGLYNQGQVDLIWAMGLASLESNNGELVLPEPMESYLAESQINDLKLRLSRHLNAPTIAFLDREAQVFRIMRIPALKNGEGSHPYSPVFSSPSPRISKVLKEPTASYKVKANVKKDKVPRPPNAFILYRKEKHPMLKSEHPEYHNNDISVILGKQWKCEPDAVKARYKKLADDIKTRHMREHPDYQYAPRKPSEKKRRMTARKAAALAKADDMLALDVQSDEDVSETSSPAMADFQELLGTGRPQHLNQFVENRQGDIGFTLPTNNTPKLHSMVNAHNNDLHPGTTTPFDPANQYQMTSTVPNYVQNDQDFVDSLVDWEGIAADVALIKDASAEEMAQIADVEFGSDFLSFAEENQRSLFEAELARTMQYFK